MLLRVTLYRHVHSWLLPHGNLKTRRVEPILNACNVCQPSAVMQVVHQAALTQPRSEKPFPPGSANTAQGCPPRGRRRRRCPKTTCGQQHFLDERPRHCKSRRQRSSGFLGNIQTTPLRLLMPGPATHVWNAVRQRRCRPLYAHLQADNEI